MHRPFHALTYRQICALEHAGKQVHSVQIVGVCVRIKVGICSALCQLSSLTGSRPGFKCQYRPGQYGSYG